MVLIIRDFMSEIKKTYEQYCTNFGANVVMEEILTLDGGKQIRCTNEKCPSKDKGCQNKLLQNC